MSESSSESSRGELGGAGKVGTTTEPLLGCDGALGVEVFGPGVTVGSTVVSGLVSGSKFEPADGRIISITLTLVSVGVGLASSVAESVVEPSIGAVGVSVSGTTSAPGIVGTVGEVAEPVPRLGVLEPVPTLSDAAANAAKL